jgi:hypothetical protein
MGPTAYRRNARGLGDRQAFERVRMQAGALFAAGHAQAQVARTLGVARHARPDRGVLTDEGATSGRWPPRPSRRDDVTWTLP